MACQFTRSKRLPDTSQHLQTNSIQDDTTRVSVVSSSTLKKKKSKSVRHSVMSNSLQPYGLSSAIPLSMGFPRQEYWSWLPFPSLGDLPDLGIKPESPALAGGFFATEPPGKPSTLKNTIKFPFCFSSFKIFQASQERIREEKKKVSQPIFSCSRTQRKINLLTSFILSCLFFTFQHN